MSLFVSSDRGDGCVTVCVIRWSRQLCHCLCHQIEEMVVSLFVSSDRGDGCVTVCVIRWSRQLCHCLCHQME